MPARFDVTEERDVFAMVEEMERRLVARTPPNERPKAAGLAREIFGRIRANVRRQQARQRAPALGRQRVPHALRRKDRGAVGGRRARRRTPRATRAGPTDASGDPEPAGPGDPAGVGTSQQRLTQRPPAGRCYWLAWRGERRAVLAGIRRTGTLAPAGQLALLRDESAEERRA